MESRTQGLRPRTQKKSEAKDSPYEDRTFRGQGQECSRLRSRTKDTEASVFQKKGLQKFFQAISKREKQKRSSQIFREVSDVLLHNFKIKQSPTIVGTDAQAQLHITLCGDPPI